MTEERRSAVVVCGNAGTGKSTYGRALARRLHAALVDIDTCTERLARLVLRQAGLSEDDRDSAAYKALLRAPVYEAMFDIAAENLRHVDCVLVGPFTTERRVATWPRELEERLGASMRVVYVWCEDNTRRERIAARGNPRDWAKLRDWDRYASLGVDGTPPPFPHQLVDTTRPFSPEM